MFGAVAGVSLLALDFHTLGLLPSATVGAATLALPSDRMPTPLAPHAAAALLSALQCERALQRLLLDDGGDRVVRLVAVLRANVDDARLTPPLARVLERIANDARSHALLVERAHLLEAFGDLLGAPRALAASELASLAATVEQLSRGDDAVTALLYEHNAFKSCRAIVARSAALAFEPRLRVAAIVANLCERPQLQVSE